MSSTQAALRKALKLNPRPLQKTVVPLGGTLPNGFDRVFYMRPDHKPTWYHIDAEGHVLGRLAAQIVRILMGKHRPNYVPSIDRGDHIVITNCEKIVLTSDQWEKKVYRWHTGYPGGLKEEKAQTVLSERPGDVLRKAVNGMLPKNSLRYKRIDKLHLIIGPKHDFSPESLTTPPRNVFNPSHSRWTPTVLDPVVHRGHYVTVEQKGESFEVKYSENRKGRKKPNLKRVWRVPKIYRPGPRKEPEFPTNLDDLLKLYQKSMGITQKGPKSAAKK